MNWRELLALLAGLLLGAVLAPRASADDVAAAEKRAREFTCYALVRSGAAAECTASYGDTYAIK